MQEVAAYAKSEKLSLSDSENFFLNHEGKGWVGVRNWKSLLKLWVRRGEEYRLKNPLPKKPKSEADLFLEKCEREDAYRLAHNLP